MQPPRAWLGSSAFFGVLALIWKLLNSTQLPGLDQAFAELGLRVSALLWSLLFAVGSVAQHLFDMAVACECVPQRDPK